VVTAINIFRSAKPSRQWGKIEPMSKDDARFWQLRRRKADASAKGDVK
jgi:hypothetical protein